MRSKAYSLCPIGEAGFYQSALLFSFSVMLLRSFAGRFPKFDTSCDSTAKGGDSITALVSILHLERPLLV